MQRLTIHFIKTYISRNYENVCILKPVQYRRKFIAYIYIISCTTSETNLSKEKKVVIIQDSLQGPGMSQESQPSPTPSTQNPRADDLAPGASIAFPTFDCLRSG